MEQHLACLQYYAEKWGNFSARLDSRRSNRCLSINIASLHKIQFPSRATAKSQIAFLDWPHLYGSTTVPKMEMYEGEDREIENRIEKKSLFVEEKIKKKKNWNLIKNIFLKKSNY